MPDINTPLDPAPVGGPMSRPNGDGLPPVGGGRPLPGRGDSVDPGVSGDGDIGADTGERPGER